MSPRGGSLARIVTGALILVAGVIWLLAAVDLVDVPLRALLPVALIVVGLALIAGSRRAHPGLIVLGLVLTAILTFGSFVFPTSGDLDGVGERAYAPRSISELSDGYELGSGQLTIDLSAVRFPRGRTTLDAHVGAGQLRVFVPRDLDVEGRAEVGIGQMNVFGRESGGFGVEESFRSGEGGPATLVLALDVGVGQIVVRRTRGPARVTETPLPIPVPELDRPRGRA